MNNYNSRFVGYHRTSQLPDPLKESLQINEAKNINSVLIEISNLASIPISILSRVQLPRNPT